MQHRPLIGPSGRLSPPISRQAGGARVLLSPDRVLLHNSRPDCHASRLRVTAAPLVTDGTITNGCCCLCCDRDDTERETVSGSSPIILQIYHQQLLHLTSGYLGLGSSKTFVWLVKSNLKAQVYDETSQQ